jgi:hypothetical protein
LVQPQALGQAQLSLQSCHFMAKTVEADAKKLPATKAITIALPAIFIFF